MASNLELGQVVKSIAGRDKGEYFVVLQIGPDPFVYIADGCRRRVESPKRKNIKHLQPLNTVIEDIHVKCRSKMRVSNKDVAGALKKVLEEANSKEVR